MLTISTKPREITGLMDFSAGTVLERYDYDAYGATHIMDASYTARTASAVGNPYTFTGRELDTLDGGNLKTMHYRHRSYDPFVGRFGQQDPIGYRGGMGLYGYVKSRPSMFVDPYGLLPRIPVYAICLRQLISRTDEQCCSDFKNQGLNEGDIGNVVCCDGRKVACSYGHQNSEKDPSLRASLQAAIDVMQECVRQHEERHMPQTEDCPDKLGDISIAQPLPGRGVARDELLNHQETLRCLLNNISACSATPNPETCMALLRTFMDSEVRAIDDYQGQLDNERRRHGLWQ
jgi:RHS repeat-associated protein